MANPLLESYSLPPFSKILPQYIEPAIDSLIKENLAEINKLAQQENPTWESLLAPMETLDDNLAKAWSGVSHLNAVANNSELRKAYNACLPKLADYASKVGQNQNLYKCYLSIKESQNFTRLNLAQQKVINDALRDFRLAGVALEGKAAQKFRELKQELSMLQSKFSDNVLDATDGWHYLVVNEAELNGLPKDSIIAAKALAEANQQTGYRFGLDFPSYHAIVTFADNEKLRETFYKAYVTRASDQGPNAGKWDNSECMVELLQVRHKIANLLGFENYAEYSLATKMASSPDEVVNFLVDLAAKAKPAAIKDFKELQDYALDKFRIKQLNPWDIAYYSEKLRQEKFAISQEMLRPYFPENKVLAGMFEVISQLYGMQVTEKRGVDTWHKDVKFFEITDSLGVLRGQFYLDLYARPHKRGGAWMDECRTRRKINGKVQVPVAYLTMNFSPPVEGKPALFTHEEVVTLFHEFGHGLHHMLTKVDYSPVSGINGVPWDAVELPSQFMENFCWQDEGLKLISSHFETGETLPLDLLVKLKKAKNFQSGMFLIRQLEFAIFDFRCHKEFDESRGARIQQILDQVREAYGVVPVAPYNRFQHSFSHIFAGGYAAGYYSYLWAEVLSADAFSRFEEEGVLSKKAGADFLAEILEQGGSKEPRDCFIRFRGRAPSQDALLRHHGLVELKN